MLSARSLRALPRCLLAAVVLAAGIRTTGAQPADGFTPLFDGTLGAAVVENGGTFTTDDGAGTELTVRLNGTAVTRASGIEDVEGYIGIQSETSAVEFRRIDIEELEPRR